MLPLLTVEREHQDGLSASLSLRGIEWELIILDLVNTLHFANVLTICSIDELGKERHIMSQSTIVILELFEANA